MKKQLLSQEKKVFLKSKLKLIKKGDKMKYHIYVTKLVFNDVVEADNPEEAFEIVSNYGISHSDCDWYYQEVEEE